jgi:hypothetical protein
MLVLATGRPLVSSHTEATSERFSVSHKVALLSKTIAERREEKMNVRLMMVMTLAVLLAIATAGLANPTPEPGWNEIDNPCFESGGAYWESEGSVHFNAGTGILVGGRPDVCHDPAPVGSTGYLRQIRDDTRSPYWDWNKNRKVIDLWFEVYSEGNAYVQVGIDWWDYTGNTKPTGAAPHQVWLPAQYVGGQGGTWAEYFVQYDFMTIQPRWISVEWAFFSNGYELAVDTTCLQSRCIPEPSTIVALCCGLVGLVGCVRRKR